MRYHPSATPPNWRNSWTLLRPPHPLADTLNGGNERFVAHSSLQLVAQRNVGVRPVCCRGWLSVRSVVVEPLSCWFASPHSSLDCPGVSHVTTWLEISLNLGTAARISERRVVGLVIQRPMADMSRWIRTPNRSSAISESAEKFSLRSASLHRRFSPLDIDPCLRYPGTRDCYTIPSFDSHIYH